MRDTQKIRGQVDIEADSKCDLVFHRFRVSIATRLHKTQISHNPLRTTTTAVAFLRPIFIDKTPGTTDNATTKCKDSHFA